MDQVTAFCRATWRHEDKVLARLAGKVDPNGADRWGHTPLSMTAQYSDLPLVELLLERGADVDQGRVHLTPVTYAARRGALDIVKLLRKHGAKMSIVTWIYLGDVARVEKALARNPALARLRDEGDTPIFHHAAEGLLREIAAALLASGASLSETDPRGETPLHKVADLRQAPQARAAAMATFLLERGAAPDARNWDDVTPLHQAVRARNLAVAEVLLARGADPNARDKIRGSAPLRRAVSGTGAGGTAGTADLMVPLTRLLLAHGADPEARDKRGVPVRASARAPDVVALLEEHRNVRRKKKR